MTKEIKDYRVLLIDDRELCKRLLAMQLKIFGFEQIDMAANGEEGLRMLQENSYDIVIVDWAMPVMDGLTLLKKSMRDEKVKNSAFVMVSSETEPHNILLTVKAGAISYITKPVTQDILNDKMQKVIEWCENRK